MTMRQHHTSHDQSYQKEGSLVSYGSSSATMVSSFPIVKQSTSMALALLMSTAYLTPIFLSQTIFTSPAFAGGTGGTGGSVAGGGAGGAGNGGAAGGLGTGGNAGTGKGGTPGNIGTAGNAGTTDGGGGGGGNSNTTAHLAGAGGAGGSSGGAGGAAATGVGAAGGAGGAGGTGTGGGGGGGGTTTLFTGNITGATAGSAGGAGGAGTVAGSFGGGGGGGGDGGLINLTTDATVSAPIAGGTGGAAPGAATSSGGGGGGGGAGLVNISTFGRTLTNTSTINGGVGGASTAASGGGGGGGGAGYLEATTGTTKPTFINNGTVNGGAGGAAVKGGNAGNGGGGVVDISTAGAIIINNVGSSITGGAGGGSATPGTSGRGGDGIVGNPGGNTRVINSGSVTNGAGGGGTGTPGAPGNAITFFGNNNTLELRAGYVVTGNVVAPIGGTNNTLTLGGPGDATFNLSTIGVQYKNFNTFNQIGTGIWTLTGSDGIAGGFFAPPVVVGGGGGGGGGNPVLKLVGTLANAPITVVPGGTITGTGSTGGLLTVNGGVVTPGSATTLGTLTVGSLALNGAYTTKVDASGNSDRITVAGPATIGSTSTLQIIPLGTYTSYPATQNYTILTATPVSGTFGGTSLAPNATAFFTYSLAYSGTAVTLTLTKTAANVTSVVGGTGNAGAVAAAYDVLPQTGQAALFNATFITAADAPTVASWLQQLDNAGAFGIIQSIIASDFGTMAMVMSEGHREGHHRRVAGTKVLPASFKSQINNFPTNANSVIAGLRGETLGRRRQDSHLNLLPQQAQVPQSFRAKAGQASFWINGNGQDFRQTRYNKLNTTVRGLTSNTYGTQVGLDYQFTPKLLLGITGGYGHTDYRQGNRSGKGYVNTNQIGVYGSYYATPQWYFDGVVSYGRNRIKGKRNIRIPGFFARASQKHHANQYGGMIETGYDFAGPCDLTLTPFADVGAIYIDESGYRERGAGNLNLRVKSKHRRALQTKVGGQVSKLLSTEGANLYAFVKMAYTHRKTLGKSARITSVFVNQATNFTVTADSRANNMVSPGAGLTALFSGDVHLTLGYNGDLGKRQRTHEGFITIGKKF